MKNVVYLTLFISALLFCASCDDEKQDPPYEPPYYVQQYEEATDITASEISFYEDSTNRTFSMEYMLAKDPLHRSTNATGIFLTFQDNFHDYVLFGDMAPDVFHKLPYKGFNLTNRNFSPLADAGHALYDTLRSFTITALTPIGNKYGVGTEVSDLFDVFYVDNVLIAQSNYQDYTGVDSYKDAIQGVKHEPYALIKTSLSEFAKKKWNYIGVNMLLQPKKKALPAGEYKFKIDVALSSSRGVRASDRTLSDTISYTVR